MINAEGPPVPIPNTEVKLCRAENTKLVTAWEDRYAPTLTEVRLKSSLTSFHLFPPMLTCINMSRGGLNIPLKLMSVVHTALCVTKNEQREKAVNHKPPNKNCDLYSSLAQSVEHLTVNQGVTGSSPVGGGI